MPRAHRTLPRGILFFVLVLVLVLVIVILVVRRG
jgi:hypothetical protein